MKRTDQKMTQREFAYCEKQFRNQKRMVRWLWPVYILIVLTSIPFIFLDNPFFIKCFGFGLLFFGIAGAVFFKKYSNKTEFEIDKHKYQCKGKLKLKIKTSVEHSINQYSIADYLLQIPDGYEMYLIQLIDKYTGKLIEGQFARCKQVTNDKVSYFYTPLQLGRELCIDKAILKYGKNFMRAATVKLYFYFTKIILLLGLCFFISFSICEALDISELSVVLMLPGWIAILMLFPKYFPMDNRELAEKLRC